jgi:hypothetical protein
MDSKDSNDKAREFVNAFTSLYPHASLQLTGFVDSVTRDTINAAREVLKDGDVIPFTATLTTTPEVEAKEKELRERYENMRRCTHD